MTHVYHIMKQGKCVSYPGNTKEEQPSGNDLPQGPEENDKEVLGIL